MSALKNTSPVKIALADDHTMFRQAMVQILSQHDEFDVIFDVSNGEDFLNQIKHAGMPDVAIVDVQMGGISGFELVKKLNSKYTDLKILTLSFLDDDFSILRMMRNGASGYLSKAFDLSELRKAILMIINEGIYHNAFVTKALLNSINSQERYELSDTNIRFLEYCCSDMPYAKIADHMCVSIRTVHGYRDKLCDKLKVKTRIGLVQYAYEHGIYIIDKRRVDQVNAH